MREKEREDLKCSTKRRQRNSKEGRTNVVVDLLLTTPPPPPPPPTPPTSPQRGRSRKHPSKNQRSRRRRRRSRRAPIKSRPKYFTCTRKKGRKEGRRDFSWSDIQYLTFALFNGAHHNGDLAAILAATYIHPRIQIFLEQIFSPAFPSLQIREKRARVRIIEFPLPFPPLPFFRGKLASLHGIQRGERRTEKPLIKQ